MANEKTPDTAMLRNDPLLAEVVRSIVGVFQPERVFLFGSRARDGAGPDSDYDLMVIVPDDAAPERRKSGRAYEALWGLRVSTDVLVWTHSAFEQRLHLAASLPSAIVREGKLLHAGSLPPFQAPRGHPYRAGGHVSTHQCSESDSQ